MATKRKQGGATDTAPRVPDEEASETTGETGDDGMDAGGRSESEMIDIARKRLMDAIPKASKALAEGASGGSVPHIKLLLQLVGLDEGSFAPVVEKPKEKTLEEFVMEHWYREP